MPDQVSTGDIHAGNGGTVNVAGGDIHQRFYNINQTAEEVYFDLPAYTQPLGRDNELKDLYNRWQGGVRHLLLYGARGMGKACVARALAHKIWEARRKTAFQSRSVVVAGYQRTFRGVHRLLEGSAVKPFPILIQRI